MNWSREPNARRRATARRCRRDALHAGQLADAPHHLLVEARRSARGLRVVRHDRHVERQHVARLEAGLRALQRERASSAACRRRRAARTTRRSASPRTARSRRFVPEVMRTLPLGQAEAVRRLGGRQSRHERQQDGRGDREADADPQQAGVDGEVERAHREARRVARQDRRPSAARSATPSTAPAPHSSRLSASSVRRSARPAGAERRADRQLAFAPHRSREDQVRDVRAGDDEDQRRRREQHQQHGARRRGDLIAQPHRVDAEVGLRRIRLGMLLRRIARVNRAQLGARRSRSAPGASRPNSSVIRCTRPSTIVASTGDAGWSRRWR